MSALRFVASMALVGLSFGASPARADGPQACEEAHLGSQRHRRAGELVRAREVLLVCARAECPAPLTKDCVGWLAEVEAALPSVTLEAKAADGRDATDATARVDGEATARVIDGRAFPIDPGPHRVVFERPGAAPVEERIVLREGEKRVVSARFPAPASAAAPPAPRVERPIPPLVWVAGGLGVAAGATFAIFAAKGASGHGDLEARACAPSCAGDEVAGVRRDLIIADVALGVTIVAAAATVVLVLTRPSVPARAADAASWTSLRF